MMCQHQKLCWHTCTLNSTLAPISVHICIFFHFLAHTCAHVPTLICNCSDYLDTYVPILLFKNICFLLAYAILMGYKIHSMDVNNTFLQALLNKDIYISQAEGFKSKEHPNYICHLICTLYGLKQEPLAWTSTLNQNLLDLGFESTPADPCIYHCHESSKHNKAYENEMHSTFCLNTTNLTVILSIYVEDLILIGLGWRQDNGNRSNEESKFDFLATRQCPLKIDEGQQKIKIVRTN